MTELPNIGTQQVLSDGARQMLIQGIIQINAKIRIVSQRRADQCQQSHRTVTSAWISWKQTLLYANGDHVARWFDIVVINRDPASVVKLQMTGLVFTAPASLVGSRCTRASLRR
jgi:hypothetical protein